MHWINNAPPFKAMAYNLRNGTRKDYKTLSEPKIPRATRQKKADCTQPLYPVEVCERQENSVKINYIGYSNEHDEWRHPSELVSIGSDGQLLENYHAYNPHQELAYQIKLALHSGNRREPAVRIELPFDRLLVEGLKQFGNFLNAQNGLSYYIWSPPPPLSGPPGLLVAATDGPPDHQWLP